MTVQISVTVWTILCFLALILILDRLLFRPMLDFMDKRREKIDGAITARQTALREREEELHRRQEERLAARKQAMQAAAEALEAQRAENNLRLAEKKAELEQRTADLQASLEEESGQILASLQPRMEELVGAFAENFRIRKYEAEAWTETEEAAAPHAE